MAFPLLIGRGQSLPPPLIPAKAGIQLLAKDWVHASVETSGESGSINRCRRALLRFGRKRTIEAAFGEIEIVAFRIGGGA
jgi:hypothetical protein